MPVELSVVVPVLNAAWTLVDQLDALVRQRDAPAFEVLVSDNGSTDATREVVARYSRVHSHVHLVDASAHPGVSAARNAGAAAAVAPALAFCDADDIVGRGWAGAMANALRSHDAVTGPLEYDSLNKSWMVDVRGRAQTDDFLYIRGGPAIPFCFSANLGVRASWHQRIYGFDETLLWGGEDADYAWRLQKAGAALAWEPAAVLHYRLRPDLRALAHQMRGYTAGHRLLYERHRDVWPLAPPVVDPADLRRRAVKSAWWIRNRRGLGRWVKMVAWEAGYVAGSDVRRPGPAP